MNAKQKLYLLWQKNPELPRGQTAKDLRVSGRTVFKYIQQFKKGNIPEIPTKIETKIVTPELADGALHDDYKPTEEEFLEILKERREINFYELCDLMSAPPKQINDLISYYRSKGMEIGILQGNRVILSDEPLEESDLDLEPLGDREIIFGIASDIHIGSIACQLTALNKFCEICKKEGVKDILSPGDLCAGFKVYPGQEHDLYAFEADQQEESAVVNIPLGFNWWVIGGNHDYSFIRNAGGHNCLRSLSAKREDIHYLGFDQATIPILSGIDLMMWHPSGAIPYAISYRLQKGIEQAAYTELMKIAMGAKSKPTLRFVLSGHLHIQMQAMFGAIFGAQCGSFEGTNNLLKRKGITPNVGGYIIKATLNSRGMLTRHSADFYYFEEIFDDYKNYDHETEEKGKIEKPILE